MPSPNPLEPNGQIASVSCTSASACTAVGSYVNSLGSAAAVVESWNGSKWTVQLSHNPGGAQGSFLSGVSCVSASACTAVGYYYNSSAGTDVTWVQAWNGSTWTIQPSPNPTGAQRSQLSAVSCRSASACTAVGSYTSSAQTPETLVESWNGSKWTIQPSPNPTNAQSYLYGVSCVSASACTAVGNYVDNPTVREMTLVESWNGSTWTIQPSPNPTGAHDIGSFLSGVSCTSASACTAVGYGVTSHSSTLVERWNGSTWTIQSSPNPTGAQQSFLYGVSCKSASACTAVGAYYNSAEIPVTLAEAWNGSKWTIQSSPNPTGAQRSLLYAVSCVSASACTAGGYYEANSAAGTPDVTLVEAWAASKWTIRPSASPPGAQRSFLSGVSCSSASACTAVGYSYNSAAVAVTLVEAWNGSKWTTQPAPNPAGAQGSFLSGVSCVSASACTAVGYSLNSAGADVTLAEVWNGSKWTVQPSANPTGAQRSELSAVSCRSASACTAVGYSYDSSVGSPVALVEAWNGSTWTIQPSPSPSAHPFSYLYGVRCVAASACTAVGVYQNALGNEATLVQRWNGSTWTLQSSPNPSGAIASYLYGVSCVSVSACTAAGSYVNSSPSAVPLVEVWNGAKWAIQPSPTPAGAVASGLSGVSCVSASACTAVGDYYTSSAGNNLTLVEAWNGSKWTVQPSPNPTGAQRSFLYGVSCRSASACTAVGEDTSSAGVDVTLVESEG